MPLFCMALVICLGSGIPDPFVEGQEFLILLLRVRKSWSFCRESRVPDPFVDGQKILILLLRVRSSWSFCWGSENPDPFVESQEFLILSLRVRKSWSFCWGSENPDPFVESQEFLILSLRVRKSWYFCWGSDPFVEGQEVLNHSFNQFDTSIGTRILWSFIETEAPINVFYRVGLTSCETLQYWKDFNRHAKPDYLRMQLCYHF